MKRLLIITLSSLIFAVGLAGNVIHTVQASAPAGSGNIIIPTQPTVVSMSPVAEQALSKMFSLSARLTTTNGTPIPNQTINFLVGGLFTGQARTDANGMASISVTTDYAAGKYLVKGVYQGSRQYNPATGTTELVILPATFEVQTVPALEGVNFKLGDQVFTSGKDGMATVSVGRPGDYTLQVLPSNIPGSKQRLDFVRWMDENFSPFRKVTIPTDKAVQVGFQVSYQVGQTFVDLQNHPVDVSRITSITMKSSQGTTYTFNDGQTRWFPASLVTRRVGGLEVVPIQYSIMNVQVDGSNVVSQAQQRFYVHPGDVWTIQLLLYSAQVSARDAFLGFTIGKGIILQYPDGTRSEFAFGKDRSVTVSSLARGIYHVQIVGVKGFTPSTPVALSQNQEMSIKVLTSLDIFMAVTFGTLFALSLILIGRTELLRRRQKTQVKPFLHPSGAQGMGIYRDQ